jgi:hypothetical protein
MLVVRRERSKAAVFAAPQASTTMSPANCSVSPSRSTVTPVTSVPASFVSRRTARVRQQRDVRVLERRPNRRAPRRPTFPCTAQGKPSQFWQRTQALYGMFGSLSRIPHGAWNGR